MLVWNSTAAGGAVTLNGKSVCDFYGFPVPSGNAPAPTAGQTSTLVYDQALDIWLSNAGGLQNDASPELMVQLCNEMSTGGWFHIPYLAADNPANFATPFATYCRDNLTPGKAKFEVGNEIWGSYCKRVSIQELQFAPRQPTLGLTRKRR